jgi:hypothetical protein
MELSKVVQSARTIRGERFNESLRSMLILGVSLKEAAKFMDELVATTPAAMESKTNGLVKSVLSLVNNQYTRLLMLSGGVVRVDLVGPMDQHMIRDETVLGAGKVARELRKELQAVISNPSLIKDRILAKEPTLQVGWADTASAASQKRLQTYMYAVGRLRDDLIPVVDIVIGPIIHAYIAILDNLGSNYVDHLDGGALCPAKLPDAQLSLLKKSKIRNHNIISESKFGEIGRVYDQGSVVLQTGTAGALVMGDGPMQALDKKDPAGQDTAIDNAMAKAKWYKSEHKSDAQAEEQAKSAAYFAKAKVSWL